MGWGSVVFWRFVGSHIGDLSLNLPIKSGSSNGDPSLVLRPEKIWILGFAHGSVLTEPPPFERRESGRLRLSRYALNQSATRLGDDPGLHHVS